MVNVFVYHSHRFLNRDETLSREALDVTHIDWFWKVVAETNNNTKEE